jgi:hypothetical protein
MALAIGVANSASAELLTGSLTYSPPGPPDSGDGLFVGGEVWPDYNVTFSWEVTDEDNSFPGFPWKYTYHVTITNPTGGALQKGISHVIIEASEGVTEESFTGLSGDAQYASTPVKLHTEQQGNDGIPESVWGIKFEPISDDVKFDMEWTFFSNRVPVWGDEFVRGGGGGPTPVEISYNYNKTNGTEKGFLSPDVDPDVPRDTNPVGLYHILRPDAVIPEPSTLLLSIIGAIGLALYASRRQR